MADPFDLSSRYYDLLYRDKDYAGESAYVSNLLRRFGCPPRVSSRLSVSDQLGVSDQLSVSDQPGAILELGCGTGAHAEILTRQGYVILGVDQSREMLGRAERRFANSGDSGFTCCQGDARSFRAGRSFDAVISLFHVASYQTSDEDIARYFKTAATHLTPGGVFVFDVWYGPSVLTQLPSTRVKRVEDDSIDVFRVAEPTLVPRQNRVEVDYQIFVTDRASGEIHRFEEKHAMRYYFEPELDRFAADAGMKIVHREEWLTGEEPSTDSWGVVFVAEKLEPENRA